MREIQVKLSRIKAITGANFYLSSNDIDSDWGPNTRDAVLNYQIQKKLSSGGLTLETIESLGLDIEDYDIAKTKP